MSKSVKIIECPRDAMQGLHEFVPTDLKIKYINVLQRGRGKSGGDHISL